MGSVRYYGYKHWTLEEPSRQLNVGKGIKGRAESRGKRNHKWHAIVKRHGLRVEICIGPVTNEEACAWEIATIAETDAFTTNHSHDDPTDIRCNFTRGGEGSEGYKHTSEALLKIQHRNIGNQNALGHIVSYEVRHKISVATSVAMMGHIVTEQTRAKLAIASKGNKRGLGNKSNTGRNLPNEHRKNISLSMKKLRAIQRLKRKSYDWFMRGK
jgi:hypothetical protein